MFQTASKMVAFSQLFPRSIRLQRSTANPILGSRRPKVFRQRNVRLPTTAILKQEDVSTASKADGAPAENPSAKSGGLSVLPESVENALLLGIVPFLWGSYGVSAKMILEGDHPMPLSILNLISFLFAYLSMVGARWLGEKEKHHDADAVAKTKRYGLELGLYLYVGSVLDLSALSYTSPSRSAFLVQLTTVFIPVASWFLGTKLSPQVWAACALAVGGAAVLSHDIDPALKALSPGIIGELNLGDLLAISAAALYSLHVLRLETMSKLSVGPLVLVESKVLMQALLSFIVVVFLMQTGDTKVWDYATNFFSMPMGTIMKSIWWCFWIGAATTSLATWGQVVGQERVGPSRAAVFYASQPIFAASIATAVGFDHLTPEEVLGGALIVAAGALLAIVDERDKRKAQE